MKKLSARQEVFCREYLIDHNGAASCVRAGYSPKCAKEQACRLLTYAHVQTRLQELQAKVVAKAELNAEWVLREFMKVAAMDDLECPNKVRSLENLAKILGMLTDKTEIKITMTPEDRVKQIAALLGAKK